MKPKIYPAYDKAAKNGLVPLYIYCNFNGVQDKFYTGEKAVIGDKFGEFNLEKGVFVGNKPTVKQQNAKIAEKVELLERIYRNAELQGIKVTKEYLRSEYEKVYPNKRKKVEIVVAPKKITFYDAFPLYLKAYQNIHSDAHLRKFKQVYDHLKNFNPDLDFENIDMEFYTDYMNYLINEAELSNNTIKHHITCLRAILTFAKKKKVDVPDDYLEFKDLDTDAVRFWHTWDEVMALYKHRGFPEGVQRVVHYYLFACFTGMRYGDVKSLKPQNIAKDTAWIVQHKGKNSNGVPLNDYALEMLDIYKGSAYCFPVISTTNTNIHIKTACQKVGIDQNVQHIVYRGSQRIETIVPKYEKMGFHCARHTFATEYLRRGGDLVKLSKILGHKSIETTMIYVKITDKSKAEEMKTLFKKPD